MTLQTEPNESKVWLMASFLAIFSVIMYSNKYTLVDTAVMFYFFMYLYSGLQIFSQGKLDSKITRLKNKSCKNDLILNLICSNAEILIKITSAFQVLSSVFIIYLILFKIDKKKYEKLLDSIFSIYYLFLCTVTYVYYSDKTIPILNNLSLLSAMIIIHEKWAK